MPGAPGAHHPEDGIEHASLIGSGASCSLRRRQQPGNQRPRVIGEVARQGGQPLEWRGCGGVVVGGAAGGMASFCARLMMASKARPGQVVALAGGVGVQGQQEMPDLGQRERDQVRDPPFSDAASAAVALVTASSAWANKTSVMWRCHGVQFRTSY